MLLRLSSHAGTRANLVYQRKNAFQNFALLFQIDAVQADARLNAYMGPRRNYRGFTGDTPRVTRKTAKCLTVRGASLFLQHINDNNLPRPVQRVDELSI